MTLAIAEVTDRSRCIAREHREGWRFLGRDPWREPLRAHIQNRAAEVLQAVNHAGGVYFRNRSHAARVAIKLFRYALELAHALGVRNGDFRGLRKAQNALGEAHDRQVLIGRISELTGDNALVPQQEGAILEQFLAGEIAGFHQRYVLMRAEV